MSVEIVEHWLQSGRNAVINHLSVKPIEHALLKGKPLSSQKGQAEAFFLVDDKGNWWILKKFHDSHDLDRHYLDTVSSLLPHEDGFLCGMERQVLSPATLQKTWGCYYTRDLGRWLDGTVLMPRIAGLDWAALADDIRAGHTRIDQRQRFTICRNLTQLVQAMENHRCCHRDLSCGNVFIDPDTCKVSLIDFDSLYHPRLRMPPATTCGTTGYTPHFAWNNDKLDPRQTWCEYVDRYALSLLNVEFLLVAPGTTITGEGGLFEQDELKRQAGSGVDTIVRQLRKQYATAAQLLERAIHSARPSDCPSPQDWNGLYSTIPGLMYAPPSLADLPEVRPNELADIINRCKRAIPRWPAPRLQDMSSPVLQLASHSGIKPSAIELPRSPWAKNKKRKL